MNRQVVRQGEADGQAGIGSQSGRNWQVIRQRYADGEAGIGR
jgi:hypothetical protein